MWVPDVGCPKCLKAENERLQKALRGLTGMYARTWDRVDGALVMMPDSIPLFEKAHMNAMNALGHLLSIDP